VKEHALRSEKSYQPRAAARINPKLEKNLVAYLAAAAAAGVGLTAAAKPAQAKVVYRPANITLNFTSEQPIDFNGDGVADVTLVNGLANHSLELWAFTPVGNGVRLAGSFEAAAFFGVPIGPGELFASGTATGTGSGAYPKLTMYRKIVGYGNASSYSARGPWVNVANRYLGVKFLISGTTHYGWVRMTVSKTAHPVITGYAYETIPNTRIRAGAISGPSEEGSLTAQDLLTPASRPATLGQLARGEDGLVAWRREEEMVGG
jgi:hypothetical protein